MATFKCKMCGGSLSVGDGNVVECEYCGTQQTLPKSTDENVQSLFNRANLLRQKSEFDKAEAIYEKIIGMDETESEAYWGVILCKFGIEYVEDPKTLKRIPTCHRTSYDSIVADEYYKKTIEQADMTRRAVYEAEAKAIDEIQKGILAISAKEEPYDVFICYKETDENGKRTQDSVIANDIYYQLKQAGYKVFYAAITLEDKLGSAYEPIIFAALNSAKVMLAIGTKADYFNAVWVKNEWSRFLKMMKTDRSKLLIPCYRDMDAYELPEEFAHLQAQDMGKIGFINDIIRGIKKILVKEEATPITNTAPSTTAASSDTSTAAAILKNGYLFLDEGNWEDAKECFSRAISDYDPENVQAYLGKLMATMQVKKKEDLKNCSRPFDGETSYKRLMRFADDSLKAEMEGYIAEISARVERQRLQKIYDSACALMQKATDSDLQEAIKLFRSIPDYEGSAEMIGKCEEQKKKLLFDKACAIMQNATNSNLQEAIKLFRSIPDYEGSAEMIGKCEEQKKKLLFDKACAIMQNATNSNLQEAIKLFRSIPDYEGSAEIIGKCEKLLFDKACALMRKATNSDLQEAIELFRSIPDYEGSAEMIKECENILEKNKRKAALIKKCSIIGSIVAVFVALLGYFAIYPAISVACGNYGVYIRMYKVSEYTIKDGVTSIGELAFYDCDSLTSVTIPNSVTSIGDGAFWDCSNLKSVNIPNSVTSIEDRAFYGCSSLKSITIPDGVTSIGSSAFVYCSGLTSVTIPNSVTSIGDCAFWDCSSLTSVTIPNSVTSIGFYAFRFCNKLNYIYYEGAEAQWEAISKGSAWDYETGDYTVIYNYKG